MSQFKASPVKSVSPGSESPHSPQKGYQQALEDFGIAQLLSLLRNYADEDFNAAWMNLEEQELENLVVLLIQRLTDNLNGKLIASYLNTIRHGDSEVLCDFITLYISPSSVDRPANVPTPVTGCYQEGDRVRWQTSVPNPDWGIVMGRFYAYAPHRYQWGVSYLIQLDPNSPSAAWTRTDTAWEEDLQPISSNNYPRLADEEAEDLETNPQPYLQMFPHLAIAPKSFHTSPGRYQTGRRHNPRPLTQREKNLIDLYSNCQLAMTPRQFYNKWDVNYETIAYICSRSTSTVRSWFGRGQSYRSPQPVDLRHLALMDFLLEHFEEIPEVLRTVLCLPKNS